MKNEMLRSYIVGFIISIVLTLVAYLAVTNHLFAGSVLLMSILTLAIVQLLVQLIFFLHLGQEKGPRWNLFMLFSTVGLLLIIVVGSLWIMQHLNYNMSPQQINQYINDQSGF